jgi:hypothetical protein
MFSNNNQSPLEYLAAFAISAAAGALLTLGLGTYINHVRDEANNKDNDQLPPQQEA